MTIDEPNLLFAYGTLAPRSDEDAARGGWLPDALRARLFDLGPYPGLGTVAKRPGTVPFCAVFGAKWDCPPSGKPFCDSPPGLVDLDGPSGYWVEGYARYADPDELRGPLDTYEGVGEGLYRRVPATTRAGRRVWVYVYARPLPPGARELRAGRWRPFARPGDY